MSSEDLASAKGMEENKNEKTPSSTSPMQQSNLQLTAVEINAILQGISEIKILCNANKREIEELREENQRMKTHVSTLQEEGAQHIFEVSHADSDEENHYEENVAVVAEPDQKKRIYDLPTYSGKPEEWPLFYANFNDTTKVFGYGNRENLMRLQKCLVGEAREAVVSLLIYPNDVPTAIEELKFRFGRSDLIVHEQLIKLQQLPAVGESKLENIVPFSTKVRNAVALLESAGCAQYLADAITLENLVRKLPPSKQYEWVQHASGVKPYATIKSFSEWLCKIARVVCLLPQSVTAKNNSTIKPHAVMHVEENTWSKCHQCGGKHKIEDCNEYLNINLPTRWETIKQNQLCFSCLRKGHNISNCYNKKPCGKNGCRRPHHKSLHDDTEAYNATKQSDEPKSLLNCKANISSGYFFKILPVRLIGPKGYVDVYAILDEGSAISIVEEEVATNLGLKGKYQPLTLQWLGGKVVTERSRKVSLEISGRDSNHQYALKNIYAVKNINLPKQSFFKEQFAHLKGVDIESYENAKPVILLGLDNAYLSIANEVVQNENPIAIRTKLGWVAFGPMGAVAEPSPKILHVNVQQHDDELHRSVDEYFNTENFGINSLGRILESNEDIYAREIMESTIRRVSGQFEIGLLWKQMPPNLPKSLDMATNRLRGIEKKMERDPKFKEQYCTDMKKYFEKEYARVLTDEEVHDCQQPVWYLPHFVVLNPNKPGKFRIVFDAAATVFGTSLNSKLLKGPEQMRPLLQILFKFRQGPIAVAADIREMFSQVRIKSEDQHAQRFLWRGEDKTKPIQHCVMQSMIFGAICSPCCAEYVKNYNAKEFEAEYPDAVKAIIEKHYVDDFVCSFSSVADASRICREVVDIHAKGGFELRNFVSNSKQILFEMNSPERVAVKSFNIDCQATTEKILGMYWNTDGDVFNFQTKFHRVSPEVLNCIRPPTKRELLSIVMSVFDPYGFIADFLLYSKVLVQQTWKSQITWDEPIPENTRSHWVEWWNEFQKVKSFKIQRCYSLYLNVAKSVELHVFVDASELAFAAAAYFRMEIDESVQVCFVAGKTRTAPKKLMSIPRLELQAAVLGVRLSKAILEGHDIQIHEIVFWSDSRTVLHWVHSSERKYKAFVGHRIAEIITASHPEQWKWVPSDQNTADAATRPTFPAKFQAESRWLQGAKFLNDDKSHWPLVSLETPQRLEEEISPMLLCQKNNYLIDFNKFSSFLKLKRVTAWVLRATSKFSKNKLDKTIPESPNLLTTAELLAAERKICQFVQQEYFAEELFDLQHGKAISKSSSIYKLSPYLDDSGLLRVHGRIDEAICLPLDTRRPIIMPRNHVVTKLIVRYFHERQHHQNVAVILNEVRQRFWVPHLKAVLKAVQNDCSRCRIDRAKPMPPLMGQLPADRLTPFIRPFTYTGVDLFGPLNVAIGRRREKRWAAIFTCLTTRAAHIEIVENLSTDAFILSLRNFVNRRGTPIRIRCDNGTNFIGAQKELKSTERLLDVDRIQAEGANCNIDWVFNCPANPSSGGCWERLIRIVKRLLGYTLKDVAPKVETLRSLLIEAENILNSRPLTEFPLASEDDDPLTPNHFLIGCPNSTQTPHEFDEKLCLNKQWRIAQNLKNRFWKRWVLEYLPQLIHRPKWYTKTHPIQINDLVIICDPSLPRSQWQKGRVIEVIPAKDKQIRIVKVKTPAGELRRPVNRLAVLSLGKSD